MQYKLFLFLVHTSTLKLEWKVDILTCKGFFQQVPSENLACTHNVHKQITCTCTCHSDTLQRGLQKTFNVFILQAQINTEWSNKLLTANAVPKMPPAKLLVPNKPNTVVLRWSENQLVSDLTQFGQAVDY